MATIEMKRLNLAEARHMCGLTGICADLESIKDYVSRLIAHYQEGKIDHEFIEVLSIAILVKYSRSLGYGGGKRAKVSVDQLLSAEEAKVSKGFIDMRSKHFAHSVNVFEENAFYVNFNRELSLNERIVNVSVQHARMISLSAVDAGHILQLTEKILRHCEEEIEKERVRLLALVRDMSLDDILKETADSSFSTNIKDVAKERNIERLPTRRCS